MKGGDEVRGFSGDNDPLDVVEIGQGGRHELVGVGTVLAVKPVGALSMLDSGELDWKILAIRVRSVALFTRYLLRFVFLLGGGFAHDIFIPIRLFAKLVFC